MIYDFFILKNGIPLFLINLEPKFSVSTDDIKVTLVSGFFQAIASFADTMENLGQVDEIQMTDILFSFQRMMLENQEGDLLFVLSTDGKTPKHIRKIIIEETCSTFLHIFNDRVKSKWDGNVEPFKSFRTVFLEIVKGVLESNSTENLDIHTDQVTQLVRFSPVSDNHTSVSPSYSALTNYNSSSPNVLKIDDISQNQSRLNKHLLSQQLSQTQHSQQSQQLNDNGFRNGAQPQVIENNQHESDPSPYGSQCSIPPSLSINPIQHFQMEKSPQYSRLMQSMLRSHNGPYEAIEYDSSYFHPSVYDLIPVKNLLTAGTFRYKIANNHAKMLIVAIDGQKSIRHLANLLNSHPQDIFGQCQDFQNQGFISFKKM